MAKSLMPTRLGSHQPSISEVALGYVSGGLLGLHIRSMPSKLDFEEPGRQEGPFHTQLRLSRCKEE